MSVWPTWAVPLTEGRAVTASEIAATAAVAADVTTVEEPVFVAVASKRIVEPMSIAWRASVVPAAPAIAEQLAPAKSQRCHWRVVLVRVPLHVPSVALRVWPSCTVPETAGSPVFVGGAAASTVAVAAAIAVAEPAAFVNDSADRSVEPMSVTETAYVREVAPEMAAQEAPAASQRCHWNPHEAGLAPVQVPYEAVSVWPAPTVPVTAGATLFAGAPEPRPPATSSW